jgi:hypothetical protein
VRLNSTRAFSEAPHQENSLSKGFLGAQCRYENMPLFAGGVLSKAGFERDQAAPCSLDTISEPYILDAFQRGAALSRRRRRPIFIAPKI